MAKTLLNAVNDVLVRASAIDSGEVLSSLTDDSRQSYIDLAIHVVSDVIDEVYSVGNWSKPKQSKVGTVTLATGIKSYSTRSDAETIRREFDLIDETNNHVIELLGADGYWQIIRGDQEQDDTGKPSFCAISPIDGKFLMDRAPTASENGNIYKYRYDRDFDLTDATDPLPFSGAAYRAMTGAAAQLWKLERHQDITPELYTQHLGRAARKILKLPRRHSWMSASPQHNATDPMS